MLISRENTAANGHTPALPVLRSIPMTATAPAIPLPASAVADERHEPGSLRRLHLKAITGKLSGRTNRAFYAVVLGISMTGAGMAAAGWLGWWEPFAFAAVGAVELGGVALSVHADERRRLGERAVVARLLSAAVAVGAVAVNWFGHSHHLGQAAFFAGMSALGYLVWLIDSAARRRDWLRAQEMLNPPAPVYGLAQWLRHPSLTRRARALALADDTLGRLGSLAAARAQIRAERRHAAIAAALSKRIAERHGSDQAEIAVNVYDLDEIARRLAEEADYDGLTAMIRADLTPERVAAPLPPPELPAWRRALLPAEADADVPVSDGAKVPAAEAAEGSASRSGGSSPRRNTGTRRRNKRAEPKQRRTAEETRKLASELATADPDLKQAEIAARLGISTRRLREVLAPSTTPEESR